MKKNRPDRQLWLILTVLTLLTITVYLQVLGNGFIQFYDDGSYVLRNDHVKSGIDAGWAFGSFYNANWHPLTWMSHMLDYDLYGDNPAGHHATNLILHTANVLLLFLLLNRLTRSRWKSAFVAALFAVHPLHVESVAWVAERKDVLSTLFWLLTTWAYVLYTEKPGTRRYAYVIVLFALGLMCKPMLVTLPFTLLLLDHWPLGNRRQTVDNRLQKGLGKLILEKFPLFALSAASCVVTYLAQQKGSAVGTFKEYSLGIRIENSLVSYVTYLAKTVWPSKLAVLYPHPGTGLPVWEAVGAGLLLVGITLLVIRAAGKRPYLPVGWFWFLGTLIPVIGLVQAGDQAMADRYTYVPLIGLFVMIAWGIPEIMEAWEHGGSGGSERPTSNSQRSTSKGQIRNPKSEIRNANASLLVPACVVIVALSVCTWVQLGYWKDDATLFEHAVVVTKGNYGMHGNLGAIYIFKNDYGKAILHLSEAVRIKPDAADLRGMYGTALFSSGHVDEAIKQFSEALRLKPDLPVVRQALEEAQRRRKEATNPDRLKYKQAAELFNQGVIADSNGDAAGATAKYKAAIRVCPSYADPYCNLARAAYNDGKTDEAIKLCQKAVTLRPDFGFAHNTLAVYLFVACRYKESWHEVHMAEKYGTSPDSEFVNMLGTKMPDPGK
jgi:protein O-mannosyl-transferase